MNKGFIKSIILIVGALVALKYFFDFDIVSLLTQGRYRDVWEGLKTVVWDKFIVQMVWQNFVQFFKNLIK